MFGDIAPKMQGRFTNGRSLVGAFNFISGRLTLTSGTPVTSSDVTAATTWYYTPYLGNMIPLYDGKKWRWYSFTEASLAVPATTNTMYDIFGYLDRKKLVLEATAWTNDTTRATSLVYQDGLYVRSDNPTLLFLATSRTTGVSGQTEDSIAKRYCWNNYNRVIRLMKAIDATASWNYSTAAWRQSNASSSNQLDFVSGLSEDVVSAFAFGCCSNSASTVRNIGISIGLDSTTTNDATITGNNTTNNTTASRCAAEYHGLFLGRHYLAWLEYGGGADTQTWFGTRNTPTFQTNGIVGFLRG